MCVCVCVCVLHVYMYILVFDLVLDVFRFSRVHCTKTYVYIVHAVTVALVCAVCMHKAHVIHLSA